MRRHEKAGAIPPFVMVKNQEGVMPLIADISYHQGSIFWSEARKKLSFVIFRASIGLEADIRYLDYTRNCGLPYAAYHYVKAGTAQAARQEARFFVDCANKARARPTIYFADIEYSAQTKATTEAVCVAFLEELRALDCPRVGLYIGQSRYKYAGKAIGMCDVIWIPRYGDNDGAVPPEKYYPKYPCDLWQYTSHGHVDGITGRVDLDLLWGDKALEWFTDTDNMAQQEGCDVSTKLMTAAELARRALDVARNYKTIYMYGCYGFQVTDATIKAKSTQGGSVGAWYTTSRIATLRKVANQHPPTWGFDCVNLYKGLLWGWTGDEGKEKGGAVYASNGVPDTNANGMFDRCTGKSSDFSKIEVGEAVWISGHFGLYVGDGLVVECTPKWKNGVQITACLNIGSVKGYDGRKWTKHGKLPYVSYDAPQNTLAGALMLGNTGEAVTVMQKMLLTLGYGLPRYGADGDFGSETQAAVKQFQRDHNLEATGIYDNVTAEALNEAFNALSEGPQASDETADPSREDAQEAEDNAEYLLILRGNKERLRLVQLAYGGILARITGEEAGA